MPSRVLAAPLLLCGLLVFACPHSAAAAQEPAPLPSSGPGAASSLTCQQMETFLRKAKIIRERGIPVGVTNPGRATLDDGTLRHDAAVQTVEERKSVFSGGRRTELNFRDSWQFNVAGYEIAKLLGLNMVPPYVERGVRQGRASLSWWVADAMMERDRVERQIAPPDVDRWNKEMYAVRVFRELIADTDVNMTNILIAKDWRIWMIDFTRAFRQTKALQNPATLRRVDGRLLANLRALTRESLQRHVGRWLAPAELEAVMVRRDLLVRLFDEGIAARGEAAVLYEFGRTAEPCGEGI